MPAVLDNAGMKEVAGKLREMKPVSSLRDVKRACICLSQIREASEDALDGWSELVSEAAFWAEAAILSTVNKDQKTFQFCIARVRMVMDDGFKMLWTH